jgi:FtsZ-interacting cell division protein ZipA
VEADDVGQGHQRAILLGRLMEWRKDHPIVRIEEQRKAHRADNRGNDEAPAQQQHDVEEQRLRDQRGRPNEIDRIKGPAPEADVAVEPFAEEKGDTKERRAERQPEMLPEEILGGRREAA